MASQLTANVLSHAVPDARRPALHWIAIASDATSASDAGTAGAGAMPRQSPPSKVQSEWLLAGSHAPLPCSAGMHELPSAATMNGGHLIGSQRGPDHVHAAPSVLAVPHVTSNGLSTYKPSGPKFCLQVTMMGVCQGDARPVSNESFAWESIEA
eukprot:1925893-Rhodomonas_salina.2